MLLGSGRGLEHGSGIIIWLNFKTESCSTAQAFKYVNQKEVDTSACAAPQEDVIGRLLKYLPSPRRTHSPVLLLWAQGRNKRWSCSSSSVCDCRLYWQRVGKVKSSSWPLLVQPASSSSPSMHKTNINRLTYLTFSRMQWWVKERTTHVQIQCCKLHLDK